MKSLFLKAAADSFNRIKSAAVWLNIVAEDLGTGATGGGTKYLADDMTWKTVTGGGGGGSSSNTKIDCGTFLVPSNNLSIDGGTFI